MADDQPKPTHGAEPCATPPLASDGGVTLTSDQVATLRSGQLDSTARYLKTARRTFASLVGQGIGWSEADEIRTAASIIRTELDALEALL